MAKEKKKKKNEGKPKSNHLAAIRGMFTGTWLTSGYIQRQRWYILFVFCLAVVYISYRYNIEQTIRKSRRMEAEVKAMHAEYVTKSAELMRLSKRSEVLRQIEQRGLDLQESETPPKRIKADK